MPAVRSLVCVLHPWMNGGNIDDTTVYSATRFVCDPPVFVQPAIVFFFDRSAMVTLFCIGSLPGPKSLWRYPHFNDIPCQLEGAVY